MYGTVTATAAAAVTALGGRRKVYPEEDVKGGGGRDRPYPSPPTPITLASPPPQAPPLLLPLVPAPPSITADASIGSLAPNPAMARGVDRGAGGAERQGARARVESFQEKSKGARRRAWRESRVRWAMLTPPSSNALVLLLPHQVKGEEGRQRRVLR